ncbi:MAG: porin family protein [bacterium]|nr:porin family protein [bacterium]
MKRNLYIIIVLLLMGKLSLAQNEVSKLEFGLGISPAMSWVNPSTKVVGRDGGSLNFGFGARINYKLSDKYAIGFEVNLQNLGAKTHMDKVITERDGIILPSNNFNLNYQLRYLEIPVVLKMHTELKGKTSYFGEFGGNIGWLLNQIADIKSDVFSIDKVNTELPEDGDKFKLYNPENANSEYLIQLNKINLGLIFGGGIQLHLDNNSKVELGLRYRWGITDIYKEDKWKGNNHAIALNIGFIF